MKRTKRQCNFCLTKLTVSHTNISIIQVSSLLYGWFTKMITHSYQVHRVLLSKIHVIPIVLHTSSSYVTSWGEWPSKRYEIVQRSYVTLPGYLIVVMIWCICLWNGVFLSIHLYWFRKQCLNFMKIYIFRYQLHIPRTWNISLKTSKIIGILTRMESYFIDYYCLLRELDITDKEQH